MKDTFDTRMKLMEKRAHLEEFITTIGSLWLVAVVWLIIHYLGR